MTGEGHPIDVDLEKILPILAREIYTTPFAFLRENVQNAFDAIRLQKHRERVAGLEADHRIVITLDGDRLSISDTGIGMTKEDLATLFWSIGKSGKHTNEARAAGVVGTFGIGGMANFGICSRLEVVTRTQDADKAVRSVAERAKLSAKEDCVFYDFGPKDFDRGTTVTGTLMQNVTVEEVSTYLQPIVQYLDVPIFINEQVLSGKPFPSVTREGGKTVLVEQGPVKASMYVRARQSGQAEVEVDQLTWSGKPAELRAVFSTTRGVTAAYQHGFMLANVPVTTLFGLGGVIDSRVLRPTAGREAVTDESRNMVQRLLGAVERALAEHIAATPGLPERFSSFFRYLSQHGRWDLAGSATVRIQGSNTRKTLASLSGRPKDKTYFAREGHDPAIMQAYSEQGKLVVLLSSDGNRQNVERNYLTRYCNAAPLEDRVTCLEVVKDLSISELALKYQLNDRLRGRYLVDNLNVQAGRLSHGAMLWSPPSPDDNKTLFVDFKHPTISRIVQLRESMSFEAVFDVFIRDSVLPHLEAAFPELRKRDFDALLRKLQSTVEYFEIDPGDIGRIQQLASATNMSPEVIAAVFGGKRPGSPRSNHVSRKDVAQLANKVNAVVQEAENISPDQILQELEVRFLETEVRAKIIDASEVQSHLGFARYYMALTPDAHVLYRRIFVERNPSTDFSWGGHRAGYLFYSHGTSVVYYDLQFEELVGPHEGAERSGTVTLEHRPIVFQNSVFLPIPGDFERHFVPIDKTVTFTVHHQILGVEP